MGQLATGLMTACIVYMSIFIFLCLNWFIEVYKMVLFPMDIFLKNPTI